jgi:hypothetical protein
MFIIAILIMISIVMYIYYKIAILKTKDTLSQKLINGKSRVCLGSFLTFFGINQYLAYQTKFILIVSIIFIILGLIQLVDGFKVAKHYKKEWDRLYPKEAK